MKAITEVHPEQKKIVEPMQLIRCSEVLLYQKGFRYEMSAKNIDFLTSVVGRITSIVIFDQKFDTVLNGELDQ